MKGQPPSFELEARDSHSELDLIQDRIRDLRENTDFVSTLFESLIGYAIIAADFDGNILAYNEGAHQIYGHAPEEIIGKRNFDIFFPREFIEAGGLQEASANLIERGRLACEGEKVRKTGETFPAQILFTLTRDKANRIVGFIEIVEDLTERRNAEKLAEESKEQARRIQALEQEVRNLDYLATDKGTHVTSRMFGGGSFRETAPHIAAEIDAEYRAILDQALIQRVYKTENPTSERIRAAATRLGRLRASPRDVVEIHTQALREKIKSATPQKATAYIEEGRLLVLEVMGQLAAFYRARAMPSVVSQPSNRDRAEGPEEERSDG